MHSDLFNFLPDISGVFLAAVGVALVVHPHPIERLRQKKTVTRIAAVCLLSIGVAGAYSSYGQRRDARLQQEQFQRDRARDESTLDQIKRDVHAILAESDRKYDALISQSSEGSERAEAEQTKGWLNKALIHFFDVRLPAGKTGVVAPCKYDAAHPYRCQSDTALAALLIKEGEALQRTALDYEQRSPTMTQRIEFSKQIEGCCLRDIGDMRSSVFDRLGSNAQSEVEQKAWENLVLYKTNATKTLSPDQVRDYAHFLELWGQTLETAPQK